MLKFSATNHWSSGDMSEHSKETELSREIPVEKQETSSNVIDNVTSQSEENKDEIEAQEVERETEEEQQERSGASNENITPSAPAIADLEEDIQKLNKFKKLQETKQTNEPTTATRTKESIEDVRDDDTKDRYEEGDDVLEEDIEDEQTRKRREFEEKFNALIKKPTKRRKNNDVDLEAMQDEAISQLKNMMKEAAYMDVDCVNNKKPATNKLKLLPQVKETLIRSNLYDSILDNNMLEAVRIWLEPLPDGSLPSFEIQKALLNELTKLPIKTIHLRESGLGKVMIFYQKSKKVDSGLKRIAEKLIGDWTRPVMGRSDNYRARDIPTANFDIIQFQQRTKLQQKADDSKNTRKSLYQESADRRKRAAAPEARTTVYTIAPQSNLTAIQASNHSVLNMGAASSLHRDERFKGLNRKLTKLSQKKKGTKKDGVSIEGRGLNY